MCIDPISATAAISSLGSSISTALAGGLGTAATVGGGLLSAYSSIQNGQAAKAAAMATADQQETAAIQALEAGDRERTLHARKVAALQGENKVALAASGIDLGSQAAIELLADTRTQAAEDAFAIRENAVRQANNFSQSATNSRVEGRNAASQGTWGALGTVLGTASQVGSRYKHYAAQGSY